MKNIVLIGFMGTGKSTIGRILAQELKTDFIDMDDYIEEREKKSIPEIFQENGETYFRNCERNAVIELSKKQGLVIATGGGTVKNAQNMSDFLETGVVFLLEASVDVLLKRTARKGQRPVLDRADHGDRRKAIEQLLMERKQYYAGANFRIDTGRLELDEAVKEIIRLTNGV